jgi:hypothetical protein
LKSNGEIKSSVDDLISRINKAEKRLTENELRCNALATQNKMLQERIIQIESQSRRDNLLLDGVPEDAPGVKENCLEKVCEILTTKMGLENARNFGLVIDNQSGPHGSSSREPKSS